MTERKIINNRFIENIKFSDPIATNIEFKQSRGSLTLKAKLFLSKTNLKTRYKNERALTRY